MPVPTSYTEHELADFMAAELGKVATLLAYAVGALDAGSYQEAVNEAIIQYGAASIALCTDIPKVRALARVEAWKKACNDLVTYYKFSSTGSVFERESVYKNAVESLDRAYGLAVEWVSFPTWPTYEIGVTRLRPVNDPYRYIPEDEQTV
jgi:hypothetical protein